MANSIYNNLPATATESFRTPADQAQTHQFFQEFNFQDLGTTAKTLNAYIAAQTGSKVFATRSHVEISNTHATAIIYVKRFVPGAPAATNAIYTYVLQPGGYVKIPMSAGMDLSILSSASSTTGIITELG